MLDFGNPEMTAIINKTQRSATMAPEQKLKFLKAAWDAVGSEFGSRHTQYEMFYAGARFAAATASGRSTGKSAGGTGGFASLLLTICRANSRALSTPKSERRSSEKIMRR